MHLPTQNMIALLLLEMGCLRRLQFINTKRHCEPIDMQGILQ
jgi:hypothetical protein